MLFRVNIDLERATLKLRRISNRSCDRLLPSLTSGLIQLIKM